MTLRVSSGAEGPSVAVAIVCICGAAQLARCLDALRVQQGSPTFRVYVCHDPALPYIDEIAHRYPEARITSHLRERTPFELAAAVLRASDADVILLTEDHCVPRNDWVARMLAARAPDRAAVGGRVEAIAGSSASDWAFYFVDFYRYAAPITGGPTPRVSVCNVAYERDRLDSVRDTWRTQFQETEVNEALRARFGTLWMEPASEVAMRRSVARRDALYERYAFGRQFACSRIEHAPAAKRWIYAALAPALPAILFFRMLTKASRARHLLRPFMRALVPLAGMVLCWSWGEFMGYVTGRAPSSTVVAPELDAMRRTDSRTPAS
jgi:hypothetical protein